MPVINRTATSGIVSMPSTGFYLFLRMMYTRSQLEVLGCVNALNGLLLISSDTKELDRIYIERVNALNGLLLISSTNIKEE